MQIKFPPQVLFTLSTNLRYNLILKTNLMKKLTLILVLLLTLISCSKQELEIQDLDIIIIDPTNEEYYKYSDASDSGMGWVETENGDKYNYYFEDEKVIITSYRPMRVVYFMEMNGKVQTKLNDNTFSFNIKEKAVFRIYY
jgi:hypothetical protein